jgi:hypothetical protein
MIKSTTQAISFRGPLAKSTVRYQISRITIPVHIERQDPAMTLAIEAVEAAD